MAFSALRHVCGVSSATRFAAPLMRPRMASGPAQSMRTFAEAVAGNGDSVTVHYTGTLDDGTQFDSSRDEGRSPLEFVVGTGQVIVGFDKVVTGLAVGGTNKLRVLPTDAYGERNDNLVGQLPLSSAPEGLQAGSQVQLSNGARAFVTEVTDETVTIDANHALAGQALTFDVELMSLKKGTPFETMTFAGGCFWGPELAFQRVPGVVKTEVGYTNGQTASPTYEQVCSGSTGHTECVQVVYEPENCSVEQLLDQFWSVCVKDPTQVNGQGGDRGTQYRTGIYYHTEEQREIAQKSLDAMQAKYGGKVATELVSLDNYNTAEPYHQQYLAKGGRAGNAQNPEKGCTETIRCYG